MERSTYSGDDVKPDEFFWNCRSYEEYAMKCDLLDVPCLYTKDQFDWMHDFYDAVMNKFESTWLTLK